MCGRFTLTNPVDELSGYFNVLVKTQLSPSPRYNIAPTQPVACVRAAETDAEPHERHDSEEPAAGPARELVDMRWGLIPYWAKDPAIGSRMINARSESVAEKPAYREAFRTRRCLVIADGFYEWKRTGASKQPYFIYMKDRRPFAFAGLWERWKPRAGAADSIIAPGRPPVPMTDDGRVESCAFLTIGPNELMESIHDRMPVILPSENWDSWLDPANDDDAQLATLLAPYDAGQMAAHPVSTHVNRPANDDPACIEPLPKVRIVRPDTSEPTPEDTGPGPSPAQDRLF